MDSYGLDNCGYCWAVAEDGIIQHHKNCKIANLQALADKRLELLKRIEWRPDEMNDYYCPVCYAAKEEDHYFDCELKEAIDAA